MAGARTNRLSEREAEFDRRAETRGDVRVVNVSPFTARFEIAAQPGSSPRFIKLAPDEGTFIQYGYTLEVPGASPRHPSPPALDDITRIEAWPGKRVENKDGKMEWLTQPGPKLPMVVAEDRAEAMREKWAAAMRTKENLAAAPLYMELKRQDGSSVNVEAHVDPAPPRVQRPAPPIPGGSDDAVVPIPDDDPDEMDTPEIPLVPAVTPISVPTKAEAQAKAVSALRGAIK